MNYIKEAQDRVYKNFIQEFGHRDVPPQEEEVFGEMSRTRMLMRQGLFGSVEKVWYGVKEEE